MKNNHLFGKNLYEDIKKIKKDFTKKIKNILRFKKKAPLNIIPLVNILHDEIDRESSILARSMPNLGCMSGCSHCCHQSVSASPVEIFAIVNDINKIYSDKKAVFFDRLRIYAKEFELNLNSGVLQARPCPFLEDNKCSIYHSRPSACRIAHSISSDACKSYYIDGKKDVQIDGSFGYSSRSFAYLNAMDDVMAGLDFVYHRVEMAHSVFAALEDNTLEGQWLDGKKVFTTRFFAEDFIVIEP